jgi:hypothetical protein
MSRFLFFCLAVLSISAGCTVTTTETSTRTIGLEASNTFSGLDSGQNNTRHR